MCEWSIAKERSEKANKKGKKKKVTRKQTRKRNKKEERNNEGKKRRKEKINKWGHSLEAPPMWWKQKNKIYVVDRINEILNERPYLRFFFAVHFYTILISAFVL